MSDSDMFRDAAEHIFVNELTRTAIESVKERVFPTALYRALTDAGIPLVLVSESHGGADAGIFAATTILRAAGAAAAPGPLLELILGQSLLTRSGFAIQTDLISLAFAGQIDDLKLGESIWIKPPVLHDVSWGGASRRLIVVYQHANRACVAVSNTADWSISPGADAADEPRDQLRGHEIPVVCAEIAGLNYDETLRSAALLRAGQILGAIEWIFARSAEYATERKQFGREIGKFQAVQQMLAELADNALASSAIVGAASAAFSNMLVAAARSRLGDAADVAIAIGHQVHGAIGFSREYGLNYRTRRLMAWRDDYGSVASWREKLAQAFVGLARDEVWPTLADTGD
jgi:acyl-CoA dehydrogenase